jgi:hypothetical protein
MDWDTALNYGKEEFYFAAFFPDPLLGFSFHFKIKSSTYEKIRFSIFDTRAFLQYQERACCTGRQ